MLDLSRIQKPAPTRIAICVLAFVAALALLMPKAIAGGPNIWIGSPLASATWGVAGDASTTPAGGHHRLAKASPTNDFAVDLSNSSGTAYVYVAPSDSSLKSRVTTVIGQIVDDHACKNGGGGDFVTVSIRFDGNEVGRYTVAHLDRDPNLYVGKAIARWGGYLGRLADLSRGGSGGSNCWTGMHGHVELRASSGWACWNKGYRTGQALSRTNFIGFVSGSMLTRSSRPCP